MRPLALRTSYRIYVYLSLGVLVTEWHIGRVRSYLHTVGRAVLWAGYSHMRLAIIPSVLRQHRLDGSVYDTGIGAQARTRPQRREQDGLRL